MGFESLRKIIEHQKKIVNELDTSFKKLDGEKVDSRKKMLETHINALKKSLGKSGGELSRSLMKISLTKKLPTMKEANKSRSGSPKLENKGRKVGKPKRKVGERVEEIEGEKIEGLERATLKRLAERKKKIKKKALGKPSRYVKLSTRFFGKRANRFLEKGRFKSLQRNLVKASLQFIPISYLSIILFTTFLSLFVGLFLFIFLMIFNFGAALPFITFAEGEILTRFLKTFWILFAVPLATFLFMYSYPYLEKKAAENKIDQELPFATIHMSAIAGSMIEPSKIFSIIISTGEYPMVSREFTKLLNEVNVYGYNLVSALRNLAFNSPSKRMGELFNGLATTITSGGNLPEFFNKRAQSLLFDYRLEREKYTRAAETFMDIYISVVIAAPMILMLLLMMMKISGLGVSFSTNMIALLMVLGVSVINIIFLTFLQLKTPKT